jgi:leucine dehydrogenase
MNITEYMREDGHEQLTICVDKETGLRAIIAIHDTTLGPALGPPRMAPFPSDEQAIVEALRFSQAQTYKYAIAGLPFGGGRIIVIGDPTKDKSEPLIRSLGRFVDSMGGRYIITGGGAGFTDADTELLRHETSHIIGLPAALGGSGEPAIFAGYSVFLGMKACARKVFGSDSLKGRKVAIQGFGKVGSALAENLKKEDVRMVVSDIRAEAIGYARKEFNAEIVDPDAIYDVECDIFSPCAWGGILNSKTIPRLKCKIVAGSANNQLEDRDRHSQELQQRGILYAPDYVINAGGFINITSEIGGYKPELARARIQQIPQVLEKILSSAKADDITTVKAADQLAENRLKQARKVKGI